MQSRSTGVRVAASSSTLCNAPCRSIYSQASVAAAAKSTLSLWSELVNSACYTQNVRMDFIFIVPSVLCPDTHSFH
jgi:hypothetical protein